MANSTSKASKTKKKTAKKVTKKPAKATKKAAASKKTTAKTSPRKTRTKAMDPSVRQKMIEETAYFHAQQRNFTAGNAMDDWLSAETEVDKNLRK